MVEITSTTTTFGQVDVILPGVARTSTIARSKRLATVVNTVEPLFRISSSEMSLLRPREPKNQSTRASDRGWNFSTMTAISPPPDGTNRTAMLAARRVQQEAGDHVKKPQLEPPACPCDASRAERGLAAALRATSARLQLANCYQLTSVHSGSTIKAWQQPTPGLVLCYARSTMLACFELVFAREPSRRITSQRRPKSQFSVCRPPVWKRKQTKNIATPI